MATLGLSVGCQDEDGGLDASTGAGQDASTVDSGLPDAGGVVCTPLSLGAVTLDDAQDVQTIYSARLQTALEAGAPDYLVFNFVNINERFGAQALGTFSLAETPNDNRGTCAECISVFADQVTATSVPAKVFFQSAGSLTLTTNPRNRVFRGRVQGLTLVEVTIDGFTLESTPVPGGACLTVPDFDVDYKFVPPEWTCDAGLFQSGGMCNCDCGAPDPDCVCDPFMNPDCPAVIPDDCPMGTMCTPDGCKSSCDIFSNPPVRCQAGELCAFADAGPVCIDATNRTNPAQLGEICANVGRLVQYCAIQNTVPAGVCDDFDQRCRPVCMASGVCGSDEQCFTISGGPEGTGGYGYCRPAGDVPPPEWICDPDDYSDGAFCNCNCGAIDLDCEGNQLTVRGCDEGQMCVAGRCE